MITGRFEGEGNLSSSDPSFVLSRQNFDQCSLTRPWSESVMECKELNVPTYRLDQEWPSFVQSARPH